MRSFVIQLFLRQLMNHLNMLDVHRWMADMKCFASNDVPQGRFIDEPTQESSSLTPHVTSFQKSVCFLSYRIVFLYLLRVKNA